VTAAASEPAGADAIELTVVVPAYNEEQRIDRTLRSAIDYLARRHPRFELIVVDDGSTDETLQRCARYAAEDPRVRVIALGTNQGKGAAVRTGMLQARGARALFMDADLSTPMHELERLSAAADRGVDVVFASRGLPNSHVRRSQGKIRENMGRTFNAIVQSVVLSGIHDTQCGFKLFSAHAARELFSRARVDRFAFDVELLLLARQLGLRLEEVGVDWFHDPQSRVSPFTDAARMLVDVVALRARLGRRRL
jgi:dolichyl-phosphate beta-glucosyltransferase